MTHGDADDVSPLQRAAASSRRCRRCARRPTSGAGDAVQARARTSRGSCRRRRAARDRSTPLTEPAELALLAASSTRRRGHRGGGRSAATTARPSPRSPRCGPAVDRFFTDVFVMADDGALRTARLALMAPICATLILCISRTFPKSFLKRSRRTNGEETRTEDRGTSRRSTRQSPRTQGAEGQEGVARNAAKTRARRRLAKARRAASTSTSSAARPTATAR